MYTFIEKQVSNKLLSWDYFVTFIYDIVDQLTSQVVNSQNLVSPNVCDCLNSILELYKVIFSNNVAFKCFMKIDNSAGTTPIQQSKEDLVLFPLTESNDPQNFNSNYEFSERIISLLFMLFCTPVSKSIKKNVLETLSLIPKRSKFLASRFWATIEEMRLIALENRGISYEYHIEVQTGNYSLSVAFLKLACKLLKVTSIPVQSNYVSPLIRFAKDEILSQFPHHFETIDQALGLAKYSFDILKIIIELGMTSDDAFAFSDNNLIKLLSNAHNLDA